MHIGSPGGERHWYIANGLSLHRAEQDTHSRNELRQKIGVKSDETLALFLGWNLHGKGLDVAVKACEKYREKEPNFKLGVIGVGHGEPYGKTVDFLEKAGCNPHQDWILYLDDYEDIFALNRAIDVYISASRADAFSYGILEAISQDKVVVVSDIEGTSWSWEYSKCVPFKSENADDCARALEQAVLLRNNKSNCEKIIKKYSIEDWCEKVINIYNEITH